MTRRRGCKESALQYLKHMILKKEELVNLSSVFNRFAASHKKAHEEGYYFDMICINLLSSKDAYRDMNLSQNKTSIDNSPARYLQHSALLSSSITRPDAAGNNKSLIPSNIIVQTDLHTKVFEPIWEDSVY